MGDNVTEEMKKVGYDKNTPGNSPMGAVHIKIRIKEDNTMSAVNITKNNFHEEVLNSDKPVLLDFWATWCGPCRMVSPIVEEIAGERSDIKVGKVNVEEEPELARQFRIMSIPTLITFKDGKVVNQSSGAKPKSQILEML